jgi:hypothetical protein
MKRGDLYCCRSADCADIYCPGRFEAPPFRGTPDEPVVTPEDAELWAVLGQVAAIGVVVLCGVAGIFTWIGWW